MEYLLLLVASLFGSVLAWRVLRETCLLLILGLGPLLGTCALVALSNIKIAPVHSLGLLAAFTAVGVAVPWGREKPVWVEMSRWQGAVLAAMGLVVAGFTLYHQVHVLDGDRYLHDAHIMAFQRGVYPPVNPFFPDLAMNGHFGRDLLMATLMADGQDPAYTTWWVQPWIQLATLLTLFASTRSLTSSNRHGLLVAAMIFFGMNCGFRVGLIDTFEGTNGLAHPHFVLLFHLMMRILEGSRWPVWVVSGIALGTYQLVYMTSFALFLLAGFVLFCWKARSKRAWVGLLVTGLLAMGLAVTEGGAFTDMAQRGLHPELDKAVQNQGLRVTVQFPKDELFSVLTSTAGYYRTSVAYHTSLFKALYVPPKGEGYVSLFSLDFMRGQWLPLYLAPLTFWFLRRSALGMAFWLLGAISYLLPGLFYFGPIFEYEFFRFSFSAAYGFAGALGLALADWLERSPIKVERKPHLSLSFPPGSLRYLAAVAVLLASLAAGEKAVNDAIIASQKNGFSWFPNVRQWRLNEPLFAINEDILKASEDLRSRTQPGDRILTNLLTDEPMGLWPSIVVATLAGGFPAGHAYPAQTAGRPHGSPAYRKNAIYHSFWETGDLTVLEGSKVGWLFADTSRLEPSVVASLKKLPHQSFGTVVTAQVPPSTFSESSSPPLWTVKVEALSEPEELRVGKRYAVAVSFENPGRESRAVLTLDTPLVEPLIFKVPPGSSRQELSLVTPLDEGAFEAKICDLAGNEKSRIPFTVDFLKRLENLSCELSFPQMKVQRFATLQGRWSSLEALHSEGELDIAYRFRRPDGDYAWEVDSIPQPWTLKLPEEPNFELHVMTPQAPGAYELELWFFDRGSGRRIKSKSSFPVVVES